MADELATSVADAGRTFSVPLGSTGGSVWWSKHRAESTTVRDRKQAEAESIIDHTDRRLEDGDNGGYERRNVISNGR
eukprot:5273628-Pleurochrysis_carterae.AAC.2